MTTPLPLGNPWRKTTFRYWHHAFTIAPLYLRSYWQRARQGFSAPDVWGFDTYLAQVIAGGLRRLANSEHAMPSVGSSYYPPDVEWGKEDIAIHETAHDAWVVDLEFAAGKLERYVDDEIVSLDEEQRRYEAAREAMRWVAENFGSLWD